MKVNFLQIIINNNDGARVSFFDWLIWKKIYFYCIKKKNKLKLNSVKI